MPHQHSPDASNSSATVGEQLASIIERLPEDKLTLGELLDAFSEEGMLLLTILLTLVFLIPVSIPGVSTVFGAAILLIGVSRLLKRPLWLPSKLMHKQLPASKLRPGLNAGMVWVRRMEKISRPHRLRGVVDGRVPDMLNNLAFILAALLLMAPFGFVPFSNTLPALALLLYAIGFMQRDGGAVLLGHLSNIGTIIYFGVLIGGGGVAAHGLLQRFTG
ncbi:MULTISPECIES: exopolysaccharide biosynthesis protein [unclassified Pseudoxanthomonas]|jgi:hypothetical protein|uniref:exopolysaccharide biosynthesis protein n=1 Tax=unclassified Pseudoxanthomonas TaxID=2645906 RepID=UPI0030780ECD